MLVTYPIFVLIICLCVFLAPAGGQAAVRTASVAGMVQEAAQVDQQWIAVKRDLITLQQQLSGSSGAQVTVYLTLDGDTLSDLVSISMSIDQKLAVLYHYSERDSGALQQGGTQPLILGAVSPGEHDIEVIVSSRDNAGNVAANQAHLRLKKDNQPSNLALRVSQLNLKSPQLAIHFSPTSPSHPPVYGLALYQYLQGNYVDAGGLILTAQQVGELQQDDRAAAVLLARCFMTLGMLDEAKRSTFQSSSGAGDVERRQIIEQLAQAYFNQGLFVDAQNLIDLSGVSSDQLLHLKAQILLAQDNAVAASALLEGAPGLQDDPYARYNLAVALYRSGQAAKADSVLDSLGRRAVQGAEGLAFRDKVNLDLGQQRADADDLTGALEAFARMRDEGPYKNAKRQSVGRVYARQQQWQAALDAWQEVSSDAMPDAFAFWQAIALERLDARKQALDVYQQALASLQLKQDRLARATEVSVMDEILLADSLVTQAVPNVLEELIISTSFQMLLVQFSHATLQINGLRQASEQLQGMRNALPPFGELTAQCEILLQRVQGLTTQVLSQQQKVRSELHLQLRQQLVLEIEQLKGYQDQARFGLARLLDASAHPQREARR